MVDTSCRVALQQFVCVGSEEEDAAASFIPQRVEPLPHPVHNAIVIVDQNGETVGFAEVHCAEPVTETEVSRIKIIAKVVEYLSHKSLKRFKIRPSKLL